MVSKYRDILEPPKTNGITQGSAHGSATGTPSVSHRNSQQSTYNIHGVARRAVKCHRLISSNL